MKFEENMPIYLQISDLIKNRILKYQYKPGTKLPSVRELSLELKVNPNTIQRAYSELDLSGLVFTRRGMGTFVREDDSVVENLKMEIVREHVENFLEEMKNLGISKEEIIKIIEKTI